MDSKKNYVGGNVEGNNYVKIGDGPENHYHIHQPLFRFPKELTLSVPKTHPTDIIGRQEDLEELCRLLHEEKRVVLVNGLGGIGKTTLAQVYVSKYYDQYHHIAWITQTSEAVINDFVNTKGLVTNLNISVDEIDSNKLGEEVVRKLKSIADKPNLLIIDNAEQSLKTYRNILPNQPNWHLLITSREEIDGFYAQSLGFLNEDLAVALFKKYYTHPKLNEQDIKELVATVDYHTLTIELLAKTAQVQRYDVSVLKVAIEQDLKANVEIAHNQQGNKIDRVGTYLRTVFSLSNLTEEEIWLLRQFACLPYDYHTYDLLRELIVDELESTAAVFAEALANLSKKGWLLNDKLSDSYKMHVIIAEVVKKEKQLQLSELTTLIKRVDKRLTIDQSKDNPVEKFIWINYGYSLLNSINKEESDLTASLQNSLALVFKAYGNYTEAKALLIKAQSFNENKYGEDNLNTALTYSNLATVLVELGDYKKAQDLLIKAVDIEERILGTFNPITSTSYSNLGTVLEALGDYRQAKIYLEKAVRADEREFGKNHPITAIRYASLAIVLKSLGDFNGSLILFERSIAIAERVLGYDHPTTALRYSNLGLLYKEMNDSESALFFLEKARSYIEKTLGRDHPNTIICYFNIALIKSEIGKLNEAKQLLEIVMSHEQRIFGFNHPKTAVTYGSLGNVLQKMERYQEAKSLYEKAITINEKSLGSFHIDTGRIYSSYGTLLFKVNNFSGATSFLRKAISIKEQVLGVLHQDLIDDYNNLASVYLKINDLYSATLPLLKVITLTENKFGKDHYNTATCYANLAGTLHNFGDYSKSIEYASNAISILKRTMDIDEPPIKWLYTLLESAQTNLSRYR